MHHWKSETIHGIETIYDNKKYRPYANAIDDGEINTFSRDLQDLLELMELLDPLEPPEPPELPELPLR